jgi:hypothetical protein
VSVSDVTDQVRRIAQTLLLGEQHVTREAIDQSIQNALRAIPEGRRTEVDVDVVARDLEQRFNVWVGQPQALDNNEDHIAWLGVERSKIGWRFWERYEQFLSDDKALPRKSVDSLHETTDFVLERLENPARPGPWDRRGLVVGHVQSGKTAHYTGLICKAADAGYKIIVVLAGLHNNLRSQTQSRLDEGFLGYDSQRRLTRQAERSVGVGHVNQGLRANTITNSSEKGDFNRAVANQFAISPGTDPLLFVIKKNASVLKNLLAWVEWNGKIDQASGRKVVRAVPLLMIDDEADHASVNTRAIPTDENGQYDPEYDPTEINRCIRRLLHAFEQKTYIGYTATPFANIFIPENVPTKDEGHDLFPRSFIVNLPAPSNYVGPVRIFGLDADPATGLEQRAGLPGLLKSIVDHATSPDPDEEQGWMPPRHDRAHTPYYHGQDELPPSLQRAILSFVLACAARRVRGQSRAHNSMLIHVTRYTAVQALVRGAVERFVAGVRDRLRRGEGAAPATVRDQLRRLWEDDFRPTTEAMGDLNLPAHTWAEVETQLLDAVAAIKVRSINGDAGDVLDYETERATGLSVIAVGGDKLSRGLTLEGLSISYYLRASRMYDTLMQMGRWFGYRDGYLDLCRLYTTDELVTWFRYITAANEELRSEFDRMVTVRGTPMDYGLRVRSHPDGLLVTARVKMRHGTELELTPTLGASETTIFDLTPAIVASNYANAEALVGNLGPSRPPSLKGVVWSNAHLWQNVAPAQVTSFLRGVRVHRNAKVVRPELLAPLIEEYVREGHLTNWTVVLLSGKKTGHTFAGHKVTLVGRAGENVTKDGVSLGSRLLSPRDEALDLTDDEFDRALAATRASWAPDPARANQRKTPPDLPTGPEIRAHRPLERALLLLYPLDPVTLLDTKVPPPIDPATLKPIVGFYLSFPNRLTKRSVRYVVNNIYSSQEFGT